MDSGGVVRWRTTLGAITEIPKELVFSDWLAKIVEDSREINSTLSDHWDSMAGALLLVRRCVRSWRDAEEECW